MYWQVFELLFSVHITLSFDMKTKGQKGLHKKRHICGGLPFLQSNPKALTEIVYLMPFIVSGKDPWTIPLFFQCWPLFVVAGRFSVPVLCYLNFASLMTFLAEFFTHLYCKTKQKKNLLKPYVYVSGQYN